MNRIRNCTVSGSMKFIIEKVEVVVEVNDTVIRAVFEEVTQDGITSGRFTEADHPVLKDYIDDIPASYFTNEDREFISLFLEEVNELDGLIGPHVTVGEAFLCGGCERVVRVAEDINDESSRAVEPS